jgi:uncharacterized protein
MNQETSIQTTIAHVKAALAGAEGGHDWHHTYRVWQAARHIAREEQGADGFVVELAALLHDIADSKFHGGDEEIGPRRARAFLQSIGLEEGVIAQVEYIIAHLSFKGGHGTAALTPELAIVQDADRLDAIGAIGIARTFNYGGFKNRPLYDPAIPPQPGMSKEEYKNSQAPTINHFYEKLLLLKDRMNTATGKRLAERRHRFMEQFLEAFYREWEGVGRG